MTMVSDNFNIESWDYKRLSEIFDVARVNKSQEYPKDTILIQVSATNGQTLYLDKAQRVADGSKYAALTVKEPDKYDAKYLYYILDEKMPDAVKRYASGMNLQMDVLASVKIPVHNDINTQRTICRLLDFAEDQIRMEREIVDILKKHKQEYSAMLLC